MLTENQVIRYLRQYLVKSLHFNPDLIETRTTRQRGTDIKATIPHCQTRLYVEAKGEKSSDPESRKSKRKEGFDTSQKKSHLGVALLWACLTLRKPPEPNVSEWRVGMALPSDKKDRELVEHIEQALKQLGIVVFLVSPDGHVSIKGSPL